MHETEIEVEAVSIGHFGTIRNPGDRFVIPNEKAMGSWMKRVDKSQEKPDPALAEKRVSSKPTER